MKTENNNLIMVTNEFGFNLFVAPLNDSKINVTDNPKDAELWDGNYDKTKLDYYRAVTGFKKLRFDEVTNYNI